MARNFNGSSDQLRAAIGGCNFVGDISIAAIVKLGASRDSAWRNIVTALNSSGAPQGWSMEINNAGNVEFSNLVQNDWYTGASVSSSDGWVLVAVTKATGSNRPRFHIYKFSTGVWTHANGNGSGNVPNGTLPGSGGSVDIAGDAGGSTDWFAGEFAVGAVWNANLSDALVENLPFLLNSWFSVQPAALWILDQAAVTQKVPDHAGTSAESLRTGTTVSSVSVPAFSYADGPWVPSLKPAGGTTTQLAATLASHAGLASSVAVTHKLAATLASHAGLTSSLRVTHRLAATLSSRATLTAALRVTHRLAATLASRAGLTVSLRVIRTPVATLSSVGRLYADLQVGINVASQRLRTLRGIGR